MTEAHTFGDLLRQFRLVADISREALAERSGLSAKAIGALERGERTRPHKATVELLAKALEVGPAERAALVACARSAVRPPPAAAPRAPTRLRVPIPPTPLVGREADLAHACALLAPGAAGARLVSFLGPGGVGKTRLALAVAADVGPRYRDGAVFVDLAPLHDARLVAAAIARALELREGDGRSAQDLLRIRLAERQLLLVLDNFEHLLGSASLVAELLAGCPELKVLATSRSSLRLRAERRFAVAPLSVADASQPLETIAAAPAVQLFVERAQAVRPEFALTEANAADVARICGHLDGLPLALELAAARGGLLQPDALLRRLERRLAGLPSGAPDMPERQRTLRNTLAWSHDLLEPAEQELFRRLAVFAGSFTLAAAEAVCGPAPGHSGSDVLASDTVLDRLAALVEDSLVLRLAEPVADVEPRFGLLQTIREYAAERLAASGEAEAIGTLHRDWYLALTEVLLPGWFDGATMARLEREQDNLRLALRWTVQHGEGAAGVRLGIGCWPLWVARGRYAEGQAWLAELLRLRGADAQPAVQAQAMALSGHLAYCGGDLSAAHRQLEAALGIARRDGDQEGIRRGMYMLGHVLRTRGELANAEQHYLSALVPPGGHEMHRLVALLGLARTRYEQGDVGGAADALNALTAEVANGSVRVRALRGRLAALAGLSQQGWELLNEALAFLEESRDQQALVFVHQLAADTALDSRDSTAAARHLAQLLVLAREANERPALARAFEALAETLASTQPVSALELVGAAAILRDQLGIQATPRERGRLDHWVPAVIERLGLRAASAALARGRASSLETVLDAALATCRQLAAEQP